MRLPGPVFGLAASAAALCMPSAVQADRHCYPALDAYFVSRVLVMSEDRSCEAKTDEAAEEIAHARFLSEICSCGGLTSTIDDLIDRLGAEASCEGRTELLLGAKDELTQAVDDCHY